MYGIKCDESYIFDNIRIELKHTESAVHLTRTPSRCSKYIVSEGAISSSIHFYLYMCMFRLCKYCVVNFRIILWLFEFFMKFMWYL